MAKEKKSSYAVGVKAASSMQTLVDEVKGYRNLTSKDTIRNLSPVSQERMIDICYWLWENYPLSRWIIEVIVSFLVAEKFPIESKDPKVLEILRDFWNDPVNRFDLYIEKHIRELHLFGELLLPVKVSSSNGRVRVGYIDPKQIDSVITDPENVKIVIGVQLKAPPGELPKKYRTILHPDVDNFISPEGKQLRKGFTTGDCFFFAINNVSNSPRGRSELLPIADWIDTYENFLYDYAEKWSQLNSFVWDLSIKDASPDEIRRQVNEFNKASISPGSTFGHNDSIVLEAMTPDLKAPDVAEGARIFRNHILGGVGFPSHWYGGGEDVNRASATEMSIPTMKMLSARQKYFKHILESLCNYQLFQAKRYTKNLENPKYTIITPELSTKDLSNFGAVVKNVSDGLAVATNQGWVDDETAIDAISLVLSFLGKDFDAQEIRDRIKANPPKKVTPVVAK